MYYIEKRLIIYDVHVSHRMNRLRLNDTLCKNVMYIYHFEKLFWIRQRERKGD